MIESKESYEELSLIVKDWLEKSKTAGHKLGELNSQNIRSFSKDEIDELYDILKGVEADDKTSSKR